MIEKIQYLVCAALKRPYSKVFGKGSSGFSSGEDDLENYKTSPKQAQNGENGKHTDKKHFTAE